MTKNYILCILCMLATWTAKGQLEFHWGLGAGAFQTGEFWAAGLSVAPRLNLAELSESASLSVGTKPSVTYMHEKRGIPELAEDRFGYDIPIFLAFNVGRAATNYSTEQVGVYAGAGYDYSSVSRSGEGIEETLTSSGPMIIGGVRFPAGDHTMGANISKTFSSGADKFDGLAIRVLFYFGDY